MMRVAFPSANLYMRAAASPEAPETNITSEHHRWRQLRRQGRGCVAGRHQGRVRDARASDAEHGSEGCSLVAHLRIHHRDQYPDADDRSVGRYGSRYRERCLAALPSRRQHRLVHHPPEKLAGHPDQRGQAGVHRQRRGAHRADLRSARSSARTAPRPIRSSSTRATIAIHRAGERSHPLHALEPYAGQGPDGPLHHQSRRHRPRALLRRPESHDRHRPTASSSSPIRARCRTATSW